MNNNVNLCNFFFPFQLWLRGFLLKFSFFFFFYTWINHHFYLLHFNVILSFRASRILQFCDKNQLKNWNRFTILTIMAHWDKQFNCSHNIYWENLWISAINWTKNWLNYFDCVWIFLFLHFNSGKSVNGRESVKKKSNRRTVFRRSNGFLVPDGQNWHFHVSIRVH